MNKRTLHIGVALFLFMGLGLSLQAQDPIFLEDFSGETTVTNPEYAFPDAWQVYDEDGLTPSDGVVNNVGEVTTWTPIGLGGDNVVLLSNSWFTPAGTADDWVVTPAVEIATSGYKLVWSSAAFYEGFLDGYEVYVSTEDNGNTPADFLAADMIFSVDSAEFIGELTNPLMSLEESLDDYEGETIYIAFRNNSFDKYFLFLDDIGVFPPTTEVDARFSNTEPGISYAFMPPYFATPVGPFEATVNANIPIGQTLSNTIVTARIETVDVDTEEIVEVWSSVSDPVDLEAGASETFVFDETYIPTEPALYRMTYELEHDNMDQEELDGNLDNNLSDQYYFEVNEGDYTRSAYVPLSPEFVSDFTVQYTTADDYDFASGVTEGSIDSTASYGQTLELTTYSTVDSFSVAMIAANNGTVTVDIFEFDDANGIGDLIGTSLPFTGTTSSDGEDGFFAFIYMETPLSLTPGTYFFAVNDPDDGSVNLLVPNYYYTPNCCFEREGDGDWSVMDRVPHIEPYFTQVAGAATNVTIQETNEGFTYEFQGIANGYADSWLWDFGDGNTSTLQNPTHTYAGEGDYTVTVTMTVEGDVFTDTDEISSNCALNTENPETTPTSISVTAINGAGPYTYTLTDASGGEVEENETGEFEGLEIGTDYTVAIADQDGCSEEFNVSTEACSFAVGTPVVVGQDVSFTENGVVTEGEISVYYWPAGINAADDVGQASNVPLDDYTMNVEDADGCTATVEFTIDEMTSIEDISFLNGVQINPNPVNNEFVLNIDLSQSVDLEFGIYDLSGKLMKETKVGTVAGYNNTVDVKELPSGVYILQLNLNNQLANYRLVVTK